MVTCLQRGDLPNVNKKTSVYFNDVYDHIVEVIDLLETSRELISGALDIHMSKTQNTINEVAKMFAVFAIILMWPSVIGAIYGMNFDRPEAQLFGKNAYFVALGIMIIMMVVSWVFFRAKKWI
jgi:magnesium transporter